MKNKSVINSHHFSKVRVRIIKMQNMCKYFVFIILVIYCKLNSSSSNPEVNNQLQRTIRQVNSAKCVPPTIPNGKIVILKQKSTKNINTLSLNITCDNNYVLHSSTNFLLNCFNGFWDEDNIPQCKQCVKRSYISHISDDDTDSQLLCPENTFFSNCGQRYYETHQLFIVNGTISKFAEFPWHVAIYNKDKNDLYPVYRCAGSIITEKSVLTVAHCLSDDTGKIVNSREYYVAAGKFHSDYNSDRLATQKRKVVRIDLHPDYKGAIRDYAWDIAVIIVNEPFEISSITHPICIDWRTQFENEHLSPEKYGEIAGWGRTEINLNTVSSELRVLKVPFINAEQCNKVVPNTFLRYITFDKFCAGYINGSSVCGGDSGGGLVFEKQENGQTKYYIRGLVSVGPAKDGNCDSYKYSTYTKVSEHVQFIRESVQNITTTVSTAKTDFQESSNNATEAIISCKTPNQEVAKCISLYDCKIFVDILKYYPKPDLIKFINDSQCGNLNEKKVCCGSEFNYLPIIRSNPVITERINHRNLHLLPKPGVCGRRSFPHRVPKRRIYGENVVEILDYPWIALLEFGTPDNISRFHCEGSLINKRYVMTAAFCVESPPDVFLKIRVRLGEYNFDTDNDCVSLCKGTGILPNRRNCADPPVYVDVEKIFFHPSYNRTLDTNDIVLLRLARNISYTDFIKPICLPLYGERSLPGRQMIIAGWKDRLEEKSYTTSNGTTTTFEFERIPIKHKTIVYTISTDECTLKLNESVITIDHDICIINEVIENIQSHDVGGPLMATFINSSDVYAEGVMGYRSVLSTLSVFPSVATRVTDSMEWILNTIKP